MSEASIAAAGPAGRLTRFVTGGSVAIWSYVIALAGASLVLWAVVLRQLPAPAEGLSVPWWALALAFYLAEAYVVHVHFRREAHTISLNEIAIVLGLFLLSPGALVLAQVVGAGAALAYRRRQRPVKLAFNLAQFALTTSVALVLFHSISALGQPFGAAGWAATLAATLTASLLGIGFVTVAIAIAQRQWLVSKLAATAVVSIFATVTVSCFALVAIELARIDVFALVLVLVPAVIGIAGFHFYMDRRRRHEHLQFLYESMQEAQSAPEFALAVGQLLVAAKRLVRAEYSEIFLFPNDSDHGLRSTLGPLGQTLMEPADTTAGDRLVVAEAERCREPFVLAPNRPEHVLDGFLAARNLREAIVTALHGEEGPFGFLIVGDRSGDVDSFTGEDAALLDAFARHAGVLLENDRLERALTEVTELKEQLRYQAFHDDLTGFPNRVLFAERVEAALERPRTAELAAAVLFLDLDDFKTINDSLGHSVGDELLVEVADRIRSCVRPTDTPTRLGGDEFAVLLEPTTGQVAEDLAQRLLATLARPVLLDGKNVQVHASVGIARADLASSADELLQNADVAMYAAKRAGKNRYKHYESALHAALRRRHDFAFDLTRALEREEIGVVFQPIVSLRTGGVVAFEALARWHNAERGTVMPAEFIPVAEEIGLMPELGRHVLQEACRRARAWQDANPGAGGIGVSVNLSPVELTDDRLTAHVARTLLESRLGGESLTLEITESGVMRDAELVEKSMLDLRALGVAIALDDFGTGHSSLERLDTLPLTSLKIAKPFVDKLVQEASDMSFIDAFVRLALSLGMDCVAEGVEKEIQVPRLLDGGCGLAQGFYYARPLAPEAIDAYLGATLRRTAVSATARSAARRACA